MNDSTTISEASEDICDNVEVTFSFQMPAALDYLTFNELKVLLRHAIVFNHHKQGRKGRKILFGKEGWKPEFWDCVEDILPWEITKNPKELKRSMCKAPHQPVDVWRKAFKRFLELEGIDPADLVSPSYTEEEGIKRIKSRGLYKERDISVVEDISAADSTCGDTVARPSLVLIQISCRYPRILEEVTNSVEKKILP